MFVLVTRGGDGVEEEEEEDGKYFVPLIFDGNSDGFV